MLNSEDYYKRYEDLQGMILRCYENLYLLETFEEIQITTQNVDRNTFKVLDYLCYLIKSDLCLSIWKISIDPDTRSNTISQLKLDMDVAPKRTRHDWTETETDIDKYRSKYLAHNDIKKPDIPLLRQDLEVLLNAIKDDCNALCFPNVDARAQKIEEVNLHTLALKVKWSFGVILQCTQNFYKAGDDNA